MPDLKLWYAPGACSLATHIALHEAFLPFEAINAHVPLPGAVVNIPDSFRSINAKRRVPVLAIDGEVITEAPAILLAISMLRPEMNLYGKGEMERVRVSEWLNWISGTLHSQGFGALFRPGRFTDDEAVWPKLQEHAKSTIEGIFRDVDKKIEGREWAVGGQFTVVDAFLFPFWRWGKMAGWEMEREFPCYTGLVTRVRERESARKAMETEGIRAEEFGFRDGRL